MITLNEKLDRQPELKQLLSAHYRVFRQGPGYLIYDLRSPQGVEPVAH